MRSQALKPFWITEYGGDFNVRRFSCLDQFLCLAFAQLTYRESLRDIEGSSAPVAPGASGVQVVISKTID